MENIYNYEEIEDYLYNRLSEEEKSAFEKKIHDDKGLKEEVDFYRDLTTVGEVIGDEKWRDTIKATEKKMEEDNFFIKENSTPESSAKSPLVPVEVKEDTVIVRSIGKRKMWSIAASVLFLIGVSSSLWYSNTQYSNQHLAANFTPLEISKNISRGPFQAQLNTSIEALKEKNYSTAISTLESIPSDAGEANEAQYYLGHCYLKTKNYEKAIVHFNTVVQNGNPRFKDKAEYYLLQSYLESGNTTTPFQDLMNQVANNSKHAYHKEITTLKNNMNSFWRMLVF